jgi:hypothetical protein
MRRNLLVLALALAVTHPAFCADNNIQIRLRIENRVLTATLIDSTTARDFISLLPLTLTMDDLFRREKYRHVATSTFERGTDALI